MTNIAEGMLAGLAATIALSFLMLMKGAIGLMAGTGFFGMQLGTTVPVMTLLMPLVFGAVLGGVYGMLLHRGTLNAA